MAQEAQSPGSHSYPRRAPTPDPDKEIIDAAKNLVAVWRNPDPDSWQHLDEINVVEALNRLVRAVENK